MILVHVVLTFILAIVTKHFLMQHIFSDSSILRTGGSKISSLSIISSLLSFTLYSNNTEFAYVTQDINFAMEASAKYQSTFALANVNMEDARNRDCITSIRRVTDFSFQDVDELVHLVSFATNAIRRAGLGGPRD
ncbi:hypothetical protein Lalb_Chr18g0051781 [Lupinus albus]|uniref:CWZF3/5/7 THD domain-containing protein n=1 Tax=Lupinus albus TaxID=3870 RepID=A0A6A4P5A3_LUPAL|nr:hypothetical protein Lalb_Chr18g0051781 [Lupinus albus]